MLYTINYLDYRYINIYFNFNFINLLYMIKTVVIVILFFLILLLIMFYNKNYIYKETFSTSLTSKNLFKNQIIICDNKTINSIGLDLNSIQISKNRSIFFDKLDNLKVFNKNKPNQVVIVGFCIQSDPSKKSIENEFQNTSHEQINYYITTLIGNYIIIYENKIYRDCVGLYGLYLFKHNNEVIITNNALIYKKIFNFDLGKYQPFGGGDKFCPPGKSTFANVYKPYTSQKVDIFGNINHKPIINEKYLNKSMTYDNFLKLYIDHSVNTIKQLNEHYTKQNNNIYLALTGGRDSRLILAFFLYANIPVKIVTLNINKKDSDIAKNICKKFNLQHTLIDLNSLSNLHSKKELWNNIIENELREKDTEILKKDAFYKFMKKGDCVIMGNGPGWTSVQYDPGCKDINHNLYKEYKQWVEQHPEKMMTLKNRKFLEIRVGSWSSSIQQSYDMISEIDRFSFPVSEFLISHSFLFGNKRNKKDINEYIIKELVPELANIEYN